MFRRLASALALLGLASSIEAGPRLLLRTPTLASIINVGGGGHTIQEEGSSLAQETILNFVGANVTCADSGGKTVCTITGANNALSNLSSVSVNTALIPQMAIDLGATATPWRDLYLYGSGTFGSHSFRITGTPTGNRVMTIPGGASDTFGLIGTAQTWSAINTFTTVGGITLSAGNGTIVAQNQAPIQFGTGGLFRITYQTNDTPDTGKITVPSSSNNIVIVEELDQAFDYAHAARAYPMWYWHSQSQSTTKYIGVGHDDTDGLIETGAGGLKVAGGQCTGSASLCIGGRGTAANTSTHANATAIGDNARCTGAGCTALGNAAIAPANSMAFGNGSSVTTGPGIAIGELAVAGPNQLVVGRPDALQLTEAFLGGTGPTSASPVAYALKGSGGSGTNIQGAAMPVDGGLSTGNAATASAQLRSGALRTASSSTPQTIVPRVAGGVCKILANNTATTVASMTLASNSAVIAYIAYGAVVIDGSNVIQLDGGTTTCSVTNTASTIANNACSTVANARNSATSGTVTTTWTVTAANPALIQVNVNSSLTPSTGYPQFCMNFQNLSNQAVTFP